MKEIIAGITWGAWENLFALPILIVAIFAIWWRVRKAYKIFVLLGTKNQKGMRFSRPKLIIRALCASIGLFFLFLALLRPQWNKKEQMVAQEGRDLLIAIDISRSMLTQDVTPNRLELTKQKVRNLVQQLACDRVGLLLFSGSTIVQCPLTSDYAAFFMFLDALDVETISSGTTAIDQAIKKSLELFKQTPLRKNKLLILFTDGEDFSTNIAGVRSQAQQENLKIFTMGVGTAQGAPIPLFDEKGIIIGHQKDSKGSVVISRLNESMLRDLATQTGGIYVAMDPENDDDINSIIKQIFSFEKEKIDEKKMAVLEEQYPYFLAISFICFALEWLL